MEIRGKDNSAWVTQKLRLSMAQPSSGHTIKVYRKEKLVVMNSDRTIINGAHAA